MKADSSGLHRLFVAIELPDYIKQALVKLKERISGTRWVEPRNMHLTVRFMGNVEVALEEPILQKLSAIEIKSFFLPVEGVGVFPRKGRPKVIWAGLGNAHPHLFQLKKQVDDALYAIGIEPETQAYHPHLTLARCSGTSIGAALHYQKRHKDFQTAPFKVQAFVLFQSKLTSGGPIHDAIREFPMLETAN